MRSLPSTRKLQIKDTFRKLRVLLPVLQEKIQCRELDYFENKNNESGETFLLLS